MEFNLDYQLQNLRVVYSLLQIIVFLYYQGRKLI